MTTTTPTTAATTAATTGAAIGAQAPARTASVPLRRVVRVELRKMFDTRSGFWLMASIVITALATMVGTVFFAPEADLTYYTFAKAIGFPMTVVLPMIAILSITGEWSQRTGLTTFTLVPRRQRVLTAKVVSSVVVGVAAMLFALVVGVVGNLVGTAIAGTDLVWDVSFAEGVNIVIGSLLCLLTGTMLGMLLRSSAAALVAYFVMALLLPTVAGILATSEGWFRDVQPWVDANHARSFLFEGTLTAEQWAHVGVTAGVWLVLPALLGLVLIGRSEVK
jgi:ABC-2 type transport system permease protein